MRMHVCMYVCMYVCMCVRARVCVCGNRKLHCFVPFLKLLTTTNECCPGSRLIPDLRRCQMIGRQTRLYN